MTDWNKVHNIHYHSYVQSFPVTSFLLAGVSHYTDTLKNINIGDTLDMSLEPNNQYDNSAIVIKNITDTCGYVPIHAKEKVQKHVPSKVKVIDKRIKNDIYSLRVDIVQN